SPKCLNGCCGRLTSSCSYSLALVDFFEPWLGSIIEEFTRKMLSFVILVKKVLPPTHELFLLGPALGDAAPTAPMLLCVDRGQNSMLK
ncbi:hypothetical protein HAX54_051339, partial [Datura stramonium]|nr:hypothetical protein [Datura stramonium]